MDAVLIGTGLVLGIGASPHCIAMCGSPCAALTAGGTRDAAGFHLGRIGGYMAGGAVAASSVALIGMWSQAAPVLRPFWILLQLAFLAIGILWLWTGKPIQRRTTVLAGGVRPLRRMSPTKASAAGLAWVVWPCGALQGALLIAALASDPVGGALVMGAFALGSLPALAFVPAAFRVRSAGPAWIARALTPAAGIRIAGVGLVAMSSAALLHGVWTRVAAFCPS